ncbi:hypothetical protein Tco_0584282 [Tanacetum coccineum]
MFHVSNLKKCYADEPLAVLLDGLHLDDKLHFVEEPLEIVGREVKRLKRSRIPLVKVRWNSKRGPEFTWEREDQFKKKYPHLFTKTASSSSAASTANVSVNTTGAEISTAIPKVKTAGVFVDDVAAEGLVYIKRSAAKRKDKGKAIMEEFETTQTKTKIQQEQERLGFEEALRLQE